MSVGRPTVLPRDPIFPLLLPTPPQPHPVPYQKSTNLDNVIRRRNLEKEMDELSDEENELEDMNLLVRNRGFNFLIPIGRTVTQQEERNDADDESDESSSEEGGGAVSVGEDDGDNDSGQDLDASMEDMDGDEEEDTDEDEMADDEDEYEEEPSDV
ncbi:hypothetical protein AB1N83_003087 [Pleurotus pulmonarius]|nr:hypothetical protein EYR36_004272 [Pleurotus pulmonarius]KAF4579296.1 hypothetical protein EYR36_001106 [Pleurotus pulmonarius]